MGRFDGWVWDRSWGIDYDTRYGRLDLIIMNVITSCKCLFIIIMGFRVSVER